MMPCFENMRHSRERAGLRRQRVAACEGREGGGAAGMLCVQCETHFTTENVCHKTTSKRVLSPESADVHPSLIIILKKEEKEEK
jgi:hypothetical protein